eukprot:tig00000093_g3615.t1
MGPLILAGIALGYLGWLKLRTLGPSPISELPDELLLRIFFHLGPVEAHEARLFAVCRRWKEIIGETRWESFELAPTFAVARYGPKAPERILERLRNAAEPAGGAREPEAPGFRRTCAAGARRVVVTARNDGAAGLALESLEALAAQARGALAGVTLVVYAAASDPFNGFADRFLGAALQILERAGCPVEHLSLEVLGTYEPRRRPQQPHEADELPRLHLVPSLLPSGPASAPSSSPASAAPPPPPPSPPPAANAANAARAGLHATLHPAAVPHLGCLAAAPRLTSLELACRSPALRPEALAQGLEALAASPLAAGLARLVPITPVCFDARAAAALARLPALETAVVQVDDAGALRALGAGGGLPRLRTLEIIFQGAQADPERTGGADGADGEVAAAAAGRRRLDVAVAAGEGDAAGEAALAEAAVRCLRSFRAVNARRAHPSPALLAALAPAPRLQTLSVARPYDAADGPALAALADFFCARRPPASAGVARTRLFLSAMPGACEAARRLGPLLEGKGELRLALPFGRPHACDRLCERQGTPQFLYHSLVYMSRRARMAHGPDPRYGVLCPRTPPTESGGPFSTLMVRRTEQAWHYCVQRAATGAGAGAGPGAPAELTWAPCGKPGGGLAGVGDAEARFVAWLAEADPTPPPPEATPFVTDVLAAAAPGIPSLARMPHLALL